MKIKLHKNDLPENIKLNNSVAIDTEAMGLNYLRDRLCLVQLTDNNGTCHLIKIESKLYKPTNLIKILKKSSNSIKFSSHPCGSYDKNSLKVLNELGIDIAFKDSMTVDYEMGMNSINNSSLEIARQDHVEILKMMN